MRGATQVRALAAPHTSNFNSHAPCGARPGAERGGARSGAISTHTPLAGRDRAKQFGATYSAPFQLTRPLRGATPTRVSPQYVGRGFQLTRPLRGATEVSGLPDEILCISTHTPLAGRDPRKPFILVLRSHFNSHAPCGARPGLSWFCSVSLSFQLTRPLRGATSI